MPMYRKFLNARQVLRGWFRLSERARAAAQAMQKSLNQLVREYIERLAGAAQSEAEHAAFEERAQSTGGQLQGWKFDREEANSRG